MNSKQVRALWDLTFRAQPPRRWDEEPEPLLQVDVEVADGSDDGFGGSTYAVKLWTVESGYYFPDRFYLRSDGLAFVMIEDEEHELTGLRWAHPSPGTREWRMHLIATCSQDAIQRRETRS